MCVSVLTTPATLEMPPAMTSAISSNSRTRTMAMRWTWTATESTSLPPGRLASVWATSGIESVAQSMRTIAVITAATLSPPGGAPRPSARGARTGVGQDRAQVRFGVDGVPFARKPNVVVPLAGRLPLYDRFRTVTLDPLTVSAPFHSWVIDWPLAKVQRTAQLVIGAEPARTVTSPWKPPGHELTRRHVPVHEPVPGVVGGGVVVPGVVGGGVVGGGVVGGGVVGGGVVGGGVVGGGVVGGLSVGGKRSTRSSVAAGVPRPSRLLVATHSQPSGPSATV